MNLLQLGVYMASSGPTATGLREGCHCTQLLFAVVLLTAAVTQNIPPPPNVSLLMLTINVMFPIGECFK